MAWANVQRVDRIHDTGVTTSTVTIAAATAGNLLVSACSVDKNSGGITIPTGWTRIGTDYQQTDVSFALAYKIATGGETSIVWQWVTSQLAALWVGEYSGLNATPLDKEIRATSGASSVTSLSTGTTAAIADAPQLAIAFMVADSVGNVTDTPRGWSQSFTEVNFQSGGSGSRPALSVAEKNLASVATVETTFSCTDTGDQMAVALVTFKEVGGVTHNAAIALANSAVVVAVSMLKLDAVIPLNAVGSIVSVSSLRLGGASGLLSEAVLSLPASAQYAAMAQLDPQSVLTAPGTLIAYAESVLGVSAAVGAPGGLVLAGISTMLAQLTLSAQAENLLMASVTLLSTGEVNAAHTLIMQALTVLVATGTVNSTGTRLASAAALLNMLATMQLSPDTHVTNFNSFVNLAGRKNDQLALVTA